MLRRGDHHRLGPRLALTQTAEASIIVAQMNGWSNRPATPHNRLPPRARIRKSCPSVFFSPPATAPQHCLPTKKRPRLIKGRGFLRRPFFPCPGGEAAAGSSGVAAGGRPPPLPTASVTRAGPRRRRGNAKRSGARRVHAVLGGSWHYSRTLSLRSRCPAPASRVILTARSLASFAAPCQTGSA